MAIAPNNCCLNLTDRWGSDLTNGSRKASHSLRDSWAIASERMNDRPHLFTAERFRGLLGCGLDPLSHLFPRIRFNQVLLDSPSQQALIRANLSFAVIGSI